MITTRSKAVSSLVLAMATFVLVFPLVGANGEDGDSDGDAVWQVLVYLVADNNLDVNAGIQHMPIVQIDLDELMTVGSVPGMDVFVLVDRWYGPANLFKVLPGSLEEIEHPVLNDVELNMGSPDVLRDFLQYTSSVSGAVHTLLFFWDHGTPEYIAWDDTVPDSDGPDPLTHWEVVEAISDYPVDVIAADECLVAQIEVAFEYASSGYVDYLVASEGYTGWRGYPYDAILEEIALDVDIEAEEVAVMIVEETDEYFGDTFFSMEMPNSHTAVDLKALLGMASALENLTDIMTSDISELQRLAAWSRGRSMIDYGLSALGIIDFKRFVENVAVETDSEEIEAAAEKVIEEFPYAVIALDTMPATDGKATGLGIWFPARMPDSLEDYQRYLFADEGWLEFLIAYWGCAGAH